MGATEPSNQASLPNRACAPQWRSWTAPATGEYTWRLKSDRLSVAAFRGDSMDTLEFVGDNRNVTGEFVFSALESEPYRFAAGAAGSHAFNTSSAIGTLFWGPTPANDTWAGAQVLSGAAGTVRGSNRYGTIERGERIRDVGHSSLWWSFEAPAAGWYRFWIEEGSLPFTLSVYADDPGATPGRLELIASSERGPASGIEVFLRVEAVDQRFAVRLGTRGDAEGDEFTLRWEESESPVWLRYAGRTAERYFHEDREGTTVELGDFRSLALDGSGSALYAHSNGGIAVFSRNARDGLLRYAGRLESTLSEPLLLWDGSRDRLLAFNGCDARSYEPVNGDVLTLEDRSVPIRDHQDRHHCNVDAFDYRLFTDPVDPFLYLLIQHRSIQVFSLDEDGALDPCPHR